MGTIIAALIGAVGTVAGVIIKNKHDIKITEMAANASENIVKKILFVVGLVVVLGFAVWSFYFLITQFLVSTKYEADTTVHYSAGTESDWAYAQQRKEYSLHEECYLRVMTDVSASNLKGNNKDIEVKFTFTGTDICDITLFDGVAMNIQTGASSNQVIYSYTLKSHETEIEGKEVISIFRYHPRQAGEVFLKIEYGEQLGAEYDIMNTISFVDK